MMKIVGKKLSCLWLQFKIFKELRINTNKPEKNKQKRKALKSVFLAYDFTGSSFENLLKVCAKAAGEEMEEQDIKCWIKAIETNPKVDLKQLFYQEPKHVPVPVVEPVPQ